MHPLVIKFFEIQGKKCDLSAYCAKHELSLSTLKSWKRTKAKSPSLEMFDKALAPLGLKLTIGMRGDAFK